MSYTAILTFQSLRGHLKWLAERQRWEAQAACDDLFSTTWSHTKSLTSSQSRGQTEAVWVLTSAIWTIGYSHSTCTHVLSAAVQAPEDDESSSACWEYRESTVLRPLSLLTVKSHKQVKDLYLAPQAIHWHFHITGWTWKWRSGPTTTGVDQIKSPVCREPDPTTTTKHFPWYPQKDNSKIISAADQGSQTMLLAVTKKNVWNSKGKNDRFDLMIYSAAG